MIVHNIRIFPRIYIQRIHPEALSILNATFNDSYSFLLILSLSRTQNSPGND